MRVHFAPMNGGPLKDRYNIFEMMELLSTRLPNSSIFKQRDHRK